MWWHILLLPITPMSIYLWPLCLNSKLNEKINGIQREVSEVNYILLTCSQATRIFQLSAVELFHLVRDLFISIDLNATNTAFKMHFIHPLRYIQYMSKFYVFLRLPVYLLKEYICLQNRQKCYWHIYSFAPPPCCLSHSRQSNISVISACHPDHFIQRTKWAFSQYP